MFFPKILNICIALLKQLFRWKYEPRSDESDGDKNIPFQLQRLFLQLQTSKKKSIQTHDLTKSFGWNSEDG